MKRLFQYFFIINTIAPLHGMQHHAAARLAASANSYSSCICACCVRHRQITTGLQASPIAILQAPRAVVMPVEAYNQTFCPICLNNFDQKPNEPTIITSCRHKFHTICLSRWFQESQTCPLCKKKLYAEADAIRAQTAAHSILREQPDLIGPECPVCHERWQSPQVSPECRDWHEHRMTLGFHLLQPERQQQPHITGSWNAPIINCTHDYCCERDQFCCQKPFDCVCEALYDECRRETTEMAYTEPHANYPTRCCVKDYKTSASSCCCRTIFLPIALTIYCCIGNRSIGSCLTPHSCYRHPDDLLSSIDQQLPRWALQHQRTAEVNHENRNCRAFICSIAVQIVGIGVIIPSIIIFA